MNIEPLPGRLIVRQEKRPDKIGSIHYVDRETRPDETGIVTHVAPEETRLKVGDRILYPSYRGYNVELNGEKLLGLLREDVWASL